MTLPEATQENLWAIVAARYDGDEDEARQVYESTLQRIEWRKAHGFKLCVTCRQKKKPRAFGVDSAKSDGLSNRCRRCDAARKQESAGSSHNPGPLLM